MQKNVFCLFTMLCVVCGVMSQEAAPYLVKEGKQWAVYHNNPLCSVHRPGTITYRLQGDTILHGKTYKKKWISYKEDLSDIQPYNSFMREENGKVYIADVYEEELWFDYTAQVGDTLCFKEGSKYGRIRNVYDALLSETDSTRSYRCYEMQLGKYDKSKGIVEFVEQCIHVYEELGVVDATMGYGLSEHHYNDAYGRCELTLLCVHDNEDILYRTSMGCYKPIDEDPHPTIKRGYGIYRGDTYLHAYTINESEAVVDSTDFARWNDKTVIYLDVDTIGPNAFSGAMFGQGQILYFTEKLNCIMSDAFANIMMLDEEQAEENPFGDLCIVFSGDAPSIEKNSISDYADTTYHITYVVPDLIEYIEQDIQWTYSQLVTIDDFIRGYISPENEVTVNDSTEMDVELGEGCNTDMDGDVDLTVNARPRTDIPVRIGEGENKDVYSRAPAWMRYTMELRITNIDGKLLYTDSQQCSAYGECEFRATFVRPANGIVLVYSRSIDQFGRATEWSEERVNLSENEYEGDYVTDANVDLDKTADAAELIATVGADSIRITGYYMSNCGGGLYCGAIVRGNYIELIFHDGATANCFDFHYVDFMIPRFSEEIKGVDVVEPYPLKVKVIYDSAITDIDVSDADAPYYDLTGRKVALPTRGLYIRNGRKVVR